MAAACSLLHCNAQLLNQAVIGQNTVVNTARKALRVVPQQENIPLVGEKAHLDEHRGHDGCAQDIKAGPHEHAPVL